MSILSLGKRWHLWRRKRRQMKRRRTLIAETDARLRAAEERRNS